LPEATERYRAILADHPELLRVRLELAATLYSLHDDESAEYHFRLVLATDIPDAVRTNVMLFLAAIHKRKRYALAFTASVAPDTNLNAGTSANEINLFGLPFKLDPTLQQKSGVGAVVAASGEYRVPLSEELRMRSVASLWRADYPGGQFDDMIMRTELGPQKIRNDWDASLLAVFTKRWYANDQYSEGFGPRIEAGYHGLQRWNLEMTTEYLKVNYHSLTPANGYYFTINFYPTFILSTTSYLQPILGLIHEDDESSVFSNIGYRLGLGYHQEVLWGVTFLVQPEFLLFLYGAEDPIFLTQRRDRMVRTQFSVYKRDWYLFGVSPTLSYIFTNNASNQPIHAFTRNQFEIGFTKQF
jgi:outer membrane protein